MTDAPTITLGNERTVEVAAGDHGIHLTQRGPMGGMPPEPIRMNREEAARLIGLLAQALAR